MKIKTTLSILLSVVATCTWAQGPPITYDIESNFQQVQQLDDQDFVQGAGVILRYRIKSLGRWYPLDGLGARWDARATSTSTQALQVAATVVTNTTPDYFELTLDSSQTGSAVTNWAYSFVVTDGGIDYPLGTGTLNVAASGWTGPASKLTNTTCKAYTDQEIAAVSNNIIASFTVQPSNLFNIVYLVDPGNPTNYATINFSGTNFVFSRTGSSNTVVIPLP